MKTGIFLVTFLAFVAADAFENFRDPILNIVGGSEATPGQIPYQLLLKKGDLNTCGAVLISANRALTSRHCLEDGVTFTVICGEHNTEVESGSEQTLTVSSWIVPNTTVGGSYSDDMAILRLSGNFALDTTCNVIPMASSSSGDFSGTTCTISGFGLTGDGGSAATTLTYASIPVITNSYCNSNFTGIEAAEVGAGQICVHEPGKSTCSGDSGSPLVCNGVLAGIASWGSSECSGTYPSVYTRISYYQSWVSEDL